MVDPGRVNLALTHQRFSHLTPVARRLVQSPGLQPHQDALRYQRLHINVSFLRGS